MTIRKAVVEDLDDILNLFVESIEATCSTDYTSAQITAWTASAQDRKKWLNRVKNQYFLVAEINHKLVGFASLENNNYIDLMYVHSELQGKGIAKALLTRLVDNIETGSITTNASITARPFFEKNGFTFLEKNSFKLHGVEIVNFKMILNNK